MSVFFWRHLHVLFLTRFYHPWSYRFASVLTIKLDPFEWLWFLDNFLDRQRHHGNWLVLKTVFQFVDSISNPVPFWRSFRLHSPTVDWDVIGRQKTQLTLWIAVRSTKLWQHWLTWQWIQQYIYHLWLCCRKSNKRQTIPTRAVTGSVWLTVHALEMSDFTIMPLLQVGQFHSHLWCPQTDIIWSYKTYSLLM